jgi:hypothetical protein
VAFWLLLYSKILGVATPGFTLRLSHTDTDVFTTLSLIFGNRGIGVKVLLFQSYLGNGCSDSLQTFFTACPCIFANFSCKFRFEKKIFSSKKLCVNFKFWSNFGEIHSLAAITPKQPGLFFLNFSHVCSD